MFFFSTLNRGGSLAKALLGILKRLSHEQLRQVLSAELGHLVSSVGDVARQDQGFSLLY